MEKISNCVKMYKYNYTNNNDTKENLKIIINGHYEITGDPEDIDLIRFMVGGMSGK